MLTPKGCTPYSADVFTSPSPPTGGISPLEFEKFEVKQTNTNPSNTIPRDSSTAARERRGRGWGGSLPDLKPCWPLESSLSLEITKNHAWKPLPVSLCKVGSGFWSQCVATSSLGEMPGFLHPPPQRLQVRQAAYLSLAAEQPWGPRGCCPPAPV